MKFNSSKCDILHWSSTNGVSKYRTERSNINGNTKQK